MEAKVRKFVSQVMDYVNTQIFGYIITPTTWEVPMENYKLRTIKFAN